MPAAKSTRVSAAGLDVLASSYHVADQVYTTVSVVQYPPFGTQFEGAQEKTQASPDELNMNPEAKAFRSGDTAYTPTARRQPPVDAQGAPKKQNLLYLQARIPHQKPVIKKPGSHFKEWYVSELQEGQFFFIDGVFGDPFSLEDRIFLFDMDKKDQRYGKLEIMAKKIAQLLTQTHAHVWDPALSFYDNVAFNHRTALVTYEQEPLPGVEETIEDERTVHQQWSILWREAIKHEVLRNQQNKPDPNDTSSVSNLEMLFRGRKNFFYCRNSKVWETIFQAPAYAKAYIEFSQRRFDFYKSKGRIAPQMASRLGMSWADEESDLDEAPVHIERSGLDEGQIPLPAHLRRGQAQPPQQDLAGLQARVGALEAQLRRQRQDDNTSCLLERVLERLELAD
jgi:hypothetical protein